MRHKKAALADGLSLTSSCLWQCYLVQTPIEFDPWLQGGGVVWCGWLPMIPPMTAGIKNRNGLTPRAAVAAAGTAAAATGAAATAAGGATATGVTGASFALPIAGTKRGLR